MTSEPTVFIVDDDEMARDSVGALVESMGLRYESFASAEAFLKVCDPERPGCLVTDVRMLGMSGVELQSRLVEEGIPLPVIVITAYASTPLTVKVMQRGAVTLLEKPCSDQDLWEAIRKALAMDARYRQQYTHNREIRRRLAELTQQEREVMDLMLAGEPNKVIARHVKVSIRTVETRRHRVFEKMQVRTVAELARLVIEAESRRIHDD